MTAFERSPVGLVAGVQVKQQGERESPEQAFISTRIRTLGFVLSGSVFSWVPCKAEISLSRDRAR